MEQASSWLNEAGQAATRVLGQLIEFLPTLLGAVLILVVGWLMARALRAGGVRFAYWINATIDRQLSPERARQFHLSNAAIKLLGNVTFWVIILIFVTSATRLLGLQVFSAWLDRVVVYLPTLIAGGLIILVGLVISSIVRDLATATVATAGVPHADLFGQLAYAGILVTALILGIDQIGIDVSLLVTLVAIIVAAVLGSISLAFALGARSLVGNLIGAHYFQQHYQPGQVARLGGIEGEIVEVTPVGVVLATAEGRVIVPAKVFSDQVTTLVTEERRHG